MKNRYGVDVSYFNNAIKRDLLDLSDYKPDELARIFARLSKTADPDVLNENEFSENIIDAHKAMNNLSKIMTTDESYAWSWHCNLAMEFSDHWPDDMRFKNKHELVNKAAANFMFKCFGVNTYKMFEEYKKL